MVGVKEAPSFVSNPEVETPGDPQEHVLIDHLTRLYPSLDNQAKEVAFKAISDPSKADHYIQDWSTSYPIGFQEPKPFILSAEEWQKYFHRRQRIDARMKEALLGTNFG